MGFVTKLTFFQVLLLCRMDPQKVFGVGLERK